MIPEDALPYRAPLSEYERRAGVLFDAWKSGDESAIWRFKWEHPRFKGKTARDVVAANLDIEDARTVIAREYGFNAWDDLADFTRRVREDPDVDRFESAVEAVVSGDIETLRSRLRDHPELARARSARRHHATLLHYLGANGVEGGRQKTPPTAVAIGKLLLDAGAEVDAVADLYESQCTTLSMVVSSSHPAEAGLQGKLTELFLDYGAAPAELMTALKFGYLETAKILVARGAAVDSIAAAAGLGRLDETKRMYESSDARGRHVALALAAQLGHTDVVEFLLDSGEDPNRYNPEAFHSHATPLHNAIASGQEDVVRLLVRRGTRLDMRDKIYEGTPLEWAEYLGKTTIAEFLKTVS